MSAPNESESEKTNSELYEMCVRGRDYREDYDFEMLGNEVTASLAPLTDEKFLPIAAFLKEHLDMDEEEAVETIEEAKEEADEGAIDITKMDKEFVLAMQRAAVAGIKGAYGSEGEYIEHDEEEARQMVDMMVGGYSVELGGKVMELSGDVRDATKFRGSRGSV